MKSVGIREAKAHFAEFVRAAANGERIVLTHHGEPLAVITSIEDGSASHPDGSSDASKFREALLAIPQNVNVTYFWLDQRQRRELPVESWLIDTALFESLAPGGPQTN